MRATPSPVWEEITSRPGAQALLNKPVFQNSFTVQKQLEVGKTYSMLGERGEATNGHS